MFERGLTFSSERVQNKGRVAFLTDILRSTVFAFCEGTFKTLSFILIPIKSILTDWTYIVNTIIDVEFRLCDVTVREWLHATSLFPIREITFLTRSTS